MSLLVRSEILRQFVNPLTTAAEFSRYNTGNLPQTIQMHRYYEPKSFCQYFIV